MIIVTPTLKTISESSESDLGLIAAFIKYPIWLGKEEHSKEVKINKNNSVINGKDFLL